MPATPDNAERLTRIMTHVRRIELLTRGMVKETLGRHYHSRFKGQGIEVLEVRVTGGQEKQLEGVATIRHAGKSHEVPVIIVLDAVNLAWFAQPGGLAFLARQAADTAAGTR